MKKYLAGALALLVIMSVVFTGCGTNAETPSGSASAISSPSASSTPASYDKQIEFAALLLNTDGSAISGGQLSVTVGSDVFSGTADSEGKLSIANLPVTTRMSAKITDSSGAEKAAFNISIWSGYTLDCYSNQDIVSIDIEKETTKVYATLMVTDNSYAECTAISKESFSTPSASPTDTGTGIADPSASASQGTTALGTMYVNSDGVNVRSTASTSGEKVTNLSIGTQVSITDSGTKDGEYTWYAISFTVSGAQKTGYIRNDFLSSKVMKVGKDGVNMRSSASTSGGKVATLSINTNVYLLDDGTVDGEYTWYKVRCKSGSHVYTGYVRNDLLTEA